jgi:hypothetical protein
MMSPRGQRRPGEHIPRPRRKVPKNPPPPPSGGESKSSWCPLLLPAAAARTVVALARLAAVSWQIRGAR